MNEIRWDFDLKEKLLSDQYDENTPIKNILLADNVSNYKDELKDYHRQARGHVENYLLIHQVFENLYGKDNCDYKDVMNSFWITYKCFLQMEYREIFFLDEQTPPMLKQPPNRNAQVSSEYVEYYQRKFKMLHVDHEDTWSEFLIKNFHYFKKVHDNKKLQLFAKLSHTIGNIAIVPKGFNAGRNSYDYWDWAMVYLKQFLDPLNAWELFVNLHFYQDYVDGSYNPIPLWTRHLDSNAQLLPQTVKEIEDFLDNVNTFISKRGKRLIETIK